MPLTKPHVLNDELGHGTAGHTRSELFLETLALRPDVQVVRRRQEGADDGKPMLCLQRDLGGKFGLDAKRKAVSVRASQSELERKERYIQVWGRGWGRGWRQRAGCRAWGNPARGSPAAVTFGGGP